MWKSWALQIATIVSICTAVALAQSGQHAAYRLLLDKENGVIVYLPDTTYTPGAVRTTDVHEICTETTKQFRKTTKAMKDEVDREYGITGPNIGKRYERDHLIPLELGGADEIVNLWPQEYPQAHWKDQVETWTHKEVCAGRRDLVETQHAIASNWYALWVEMNASKDAASKTPESATETHETQGHWTFKEDVSPSGHLAFECPEGWTAVVPYIPQQTIMASNANMPLPICVQQSTAVGTGLR